MDLIITTVIYTIYQDTEHKPADHMLAIVLYVEVSVRTFLSTILYVVERGCVILIYSNSEGRLSSTHK